jgi:hypothetical protein
LDDFSAQVFTYNIFAYCSICRVDCKFARNKKNVDKVCNLIHSHSVSSPDYGVCALPPRSEAKFRTVEQFPSYSSQAEVHNNVYRNVENPGYCMAGLWNRSGYKTFESSNKMVYKNVSCETAEGVFLSRECLTARRVWSKLLSLYTFHYVKHQACYTSL